MVQDPPFNTSLGAKQSHVTSVPSDAVDVTKSPYNAAGDGSTDDTAAIQQAFDDNVGTTNTIYIPSGTYLISSTLKLHTEHNGLTVKGDGDSTVVKLDGSSASDGMDLWEIGDYRSGSLVQDITIRDLVVDGDGENHSGNSKGIVIRDSGTVGEGNGCLVENIWGHDCRRAPVQNTDNEPHVIRYITAYDSGRGVGSTTSESGLSNANRPLIESAIMWNCSIYEGIGVSSALNCDGSIARDVIARSSGHGAKISPDITNGATTTYENIWLENNTYSGFHTTKPYSRAEFKNIYVKNNDIGFGLRESGNFNGDGLLIHNCDSDAYRLESVSVDIETTHSCNCPTEVNEVDSNVAGSINTLKTEDGNVSRKNSQNLSITNTGTSACSYPSYPSSGSNSSPTASFTFSSSELTVDVDASGSSDSDGSISSYEWDFGDGTTATGQTASHTYSSDGSYTISLTVTDDDGASDSSSQSVSVSSGSSTAGFAVKTRSNGSWNITEQGGASVMKAYYNGSWMPVGSSSTTLIDSFDSVSLAPYTGDTTLYEFRTSPSPIHGSNVLVNPGGDGAFDQIYSLPGNGLNSYFGKGESMICYVRAETLDADTRILFGVGQSGDYYGANVDFINDVLRINKLANGSFSNLDVDSGIGLQAGRWYRIEIKWHDGTMGAPENQIDVSLVDNSTGSTVSQISGTDSAHAGNQGVGFVVRRNDTAGSDVTFDYVHKP